MRQPKAILFDLDDTIISFDGVSGAAWRAICESFVVEYKPRFDASEMLEAVGHARRWYWSDPDREYYGRMHLLEARRSVVAEAFRLLGIVDAAAAARTADAYSRLQNDSLHLLPGAYEALEKIRSLGIRTALITNGTSEAQRGKLQRFGLEKFFGCVLIDEETGFSKPDARIYRLALEKMALAPGDCWMVGDNLIWDVHGAQQVGIFAIWNDYKKTGLPEGSQIVPDRIVNSIYEMASGLK